MSTAVMAKCWPLQDMTSTQKAVLVSMADMANDDGVCWPSVPHISMRTCLSDRAVQKAIQWLEKANAISVETRSGRSTMFTVTPERYSPPNHVHPRTTDANPRTTFTTPPNVVHPTPEPRSPRTVKESSKNRKESSGAAKASAPACPSGVSGNVWADFLKYRKGKRAIVTETLVESIVRELILAEKAGWSRDAALIETMSAGWQGVKAEWLEKRKSPVAAGSTNGDWWHKAGFDSEIAARNDGCTQFTWGNFENGKRRAA